MALPPDVQAALDKLEPQIAQAFNDAISRVTSQAQLAQITALIEAGDIAGAADALGIDQSVFWPVQQAIGNGFNSAGAEVFAGLPRMTGPDGNRVVLGFNGSHPQAEAWVKTEGGWLITNIVSETVAGVQEFIRAGIEAGTAPRAVALDVVGRINRATGKREGGIVGLSRPMMQWVANAKAELADPARMPNYFTRVQRDRRFDSIVRQAMDAGKPVAQADADRIAGRYADKLLKLRGDTIARTEALNAARAGRHEAYRQLVEQGQQVEVRWQSTPDKFTRHSHMTLNGQKVMFGQTFVSELGSRMEFPGDQSHGALAEDIINCRCVAIYKRKFG